jgi:hypothetical protein
MTLNNFIKKEVIKRSSISTQLTVNSRLATTKRHQKNSVKKISVERKESFAV